MFVIDDFLQRTFSMRDYNCWHMAQDVWESLTCERLQSRDIGNFVELQKPQSPCLVLMQKKNIVPHVGVYYEGKVLHLHPTMGACFQPMCLATLGFNSTAYYLSRNYADRLASKKPA